jgi:hypothetical protein
LLKCHAGCGWQAIIEALGADAADLFDDEKRGAGSARPASAQSGPTGLTLDGYSTAKRLPIHFVKSCGLSEFTFDRKPAVRVPYFGVGGEELAERFRIALDGDRVSIPFALRRASHGHEFSEAQCLRSIFR